jgi:hypothetical protein
VEPLRDIDIAIDDVVDGLNFVTQEVPGLALNVSEHQVSFLSILRAPAPSVCVLFLCRFSPDKRLVYFVSNWRHAHKPQTC